MKIIFVIAFFVSFAFIPSAHAQCATGVDTGGQCIPPDQVLGHRNNLQDSHAQPQQPRAVWADRWGAIAIDSATSSVGVAENQTSKSIASAESLQRCASKSNSQHCEVKLTYRNQCAALAWGSKYLGYGNAGTKSQAQNLALQACQETGAIDCKTIYIACSPPARIQ